MRKPYPDWSVKRATTPGGVQESRPQTMAFPIENHIKKSHMLDDSGKPSVFGKPSWIIACILKCGKTIMVHHLPVIPILINGYKWHKYKHEYIIPSHVCGKTMSWHCILPTIHPSHPGFWVNDHN